MKRQELIDWIEKMGCIMIRHGRKHDWYQNPVTKNSQPVPQHTKINDILANHIMKMLKT